MRTIKIVILIILSSSSIIFAETNKSDPDLFFNYFKLNKYKNGIKNNFVIKMFGVNKVMDILNTVTKKIIEIEKSK